MKLTNQQAKEICKKIKAKFKSLSYLGKGAHNIHYKLITDNGIYVIRIEIGAQFQHLDDEYYFLRKTNGKFGPKVFLYDNSHKILSHDYLVEEFIDGKHPKKYDSSFIRTMARYYRRLHNNKTDKPQHQATKDYFFDIWKIYRLYAQKTFHIGKNSLNKKERELLEEVFDNIASIVKNNRKLFSHVHSLVLKHGDPSPENIYILNGEIKMIDWEFASYSIPEFELCFFVWSYKLDEKKKNLFLREYKYPNTTYYQKRFSLIMLIHICEMMAWRVQRMHFVKEEKINKDEYCTSRKDFRNELNRDLKLIKKYKGILVNK